MLTRNGVWLARSTFIRVASRAQAPVASVQSIARISGVAASRQNQTPSNVRIPLVCAIAGGAFMPSRLFSSGRQTFVQQQEPADLDEINRAHEALEHGNVDLALSELRRALEIVRPLGPKHQLAKEAIRMLGAVFHECEEFEHGAAYLERFIFEDGFDEDVRGLPKDWEKSITLEDEDTIEALQELANCYANIERIPQALEIQTAIRKYFKATKDRIPQASVELEMARLHFLMDENAKGDKWIESVSKMSEKIAVEDLEFSAELDFQVASVLDERDTKKALMYYDRAVSKFDKLLAQEHDDDMKSSLLYQKYSCLMGISTCHWNDRDFDKTKDLLEQSLKLSRELNKNEESNLLAAWCLRGLGKLYDDFNQNAIYAEGFFKSALGAYEHPDNKELLMEDPEELEEYLILLADMTEFYQKRGRNEDAQAMEQKLEALGVGME